MIEKAHSKLIEYGTTLNKEERQQLIDELLILFGVSKRFWHFDCWDRHGNLQTITIEALNEENATIIFKAKHEDLGFDPPY